jgi:hypothetical protein
VIASVTPAMMIALAGEAFLFPHAPRGTRALTVLGGILVSWAASIWSYRFHTSAFVFDLRAYPYPTSYLVTNLIIGNLIILMVWVFFVLLKRTGFPHRPVMIAAGISTGLFVLMHAVVFGRTIYPAISGGFGGGAPVLAQVTVNGSSINGLLVHTSSDAVYLLRLDAIPRNFRTARKTRFARDTTSEVFLAFARNVVTVIPTGHIDRLVLFGRDQTANLHHTQ